MNRFCQIATIILSACLSTARCESKAEPKVEDNFKVSWSSITYTKRVSLGNPAVGRGLGQDSSEGLSLSCEVEILDPNLVLGTCATPVVEQIKDGNDADLGIIDQPSPGSGLNYEAPRFRQRFVAPTQPPRWKTVIRSALRLPPAQSSRPQFVEEIQPSRMDIHLDVGLSKQAGGRIGRIKGYFYALVAESLEYVDVPFKPSDDWVRLTPDMEIRLKEAQCTDSSFRFNIEVEPKERYRPLSVQDYLPSRIVVARKFIGEDGKPTRHFSGFPNLPAHVGGSGSGGGSDSRIKSIRFVIAVNPTHREIPFVLEDIPLPKP